MEPCCSGSLTFMAPSSTPDRPALGIHLNRYTCLSALDSFLSIFQFFSFVISRSFSTQSFWVLFRSFSFFFILFRSFSFFFRSFFVPFHSFSTQSCLSVASRCFLDRDASSTGHNHGVHVQEHVQFENLNLNSPGSRRQNLHRDHWTGPFKPYDYDPHKFDPVYIEDPLRPANNVGRNCFRIMQLRRVRKGS